MGRNKIILVIIVILLIAIGYAGYLIGAPKNKTQSIITAVPTPSPLSSSTPSKTISPIPRTASSVPEMSPSQAVQEFYAGYEDCLKNPPASATGQVSLYCQSHNPFITAAFVINLEAGGVAKQGADPVVCAQNFPQNISIGTFTIEGNTAKGKVIETFGPSTVQPAVSLFKETTWKVDNITCPSP